MNELPELHTLWDYNAPEETAKKFYALLPAAADGTNRPYQIELLTQIARTHGLRRQFEEAHAKLDEAEAMLRPEMPVPRLRYLLERGRTFNAAGEPAKSLPLFHEAFALGTAVGPEADYHTVDAAHMIAIVEPDPAEQLKWNQTALDLAETSPNERAGRWLGSLYNNIGWTYHDTADYQQALAIFEKALAWHQANMADKTDRIRIARWCIGRTLRSLERLPEALEIQQALLAESQELGEPAGFTNEEVGECLLALGRGDEARPFFAQAHTELSQLGWLVATEPERLARLDTLARGQ